MIRFGEPRFHFETVESTQTRAMDAARQGALPGTAFTAANQTAGRGRRGRSWSAPRDANVNVSVVCGRIPSSELWQLAPLGGVCVLDALRECFPALDARLRFPNDILFGGRKLAGILIEAVDSGSGAVPVIGIGVNVRSRAMPAELSGVAVAIEDVLVGESVGSDAVERVTAALFRALGDWFDVRQHQGMEPVVDAWNRGLDPGSERRFTVGGTVLRARVGRLSADGRVELSPTTGGRLRVSVADVVLGDV